MPLASSREASLARAERVEAERKEQARRKRLSLPSTIVSTTIATEDKARRRQSLRRQSLASQKSSKENDPPRRYSPPQTRSATKQKKARHDARPRPTGAGIVLTFSPPNQSENARREQQELAYKENQRYVNSFLLSREAST